MLTGLELSTIAARSSGALNCPTLAAHVDNSSRNRQRRGCGWFLGKDLGKFDLRRKMEADRESTRNFVYCYTRRDALEDGYHIDVSNVAAEAGIRFPVFLTRTVYERFVTVPPGVSYQDEAGRLWDVLWMLRFAILRGPADAKRLPVQLYVRNSNEKGPEQVQLVAECGALDLDDPRPAITVLLPDED
jgi:hypothetical protein